MAYYDALKTKWASAPAGTTQSKCDWINVQTVTGPAVRMLVQNYDLYNHIDRTEYNALSAAQEAMVQRNLASSPVDYSPGSSTRSLFLSLFKAGSVTQANLAPYVAMYDTPKIPWATATVAQGGGGLNGPVSTNDAAAAGLV